ncbi:dihydrodipicolinate synthase family protein [Terribacillus saccharophilus]|uniref:dihydrodipicolinate synthase family protein n=1 Tax=Terribacillus saccharophilus TaxID=361277 RepID=UPI000BA60C2D|nr:dihydrodipicolinate synthase family protein [Terribacillus saccharophilus]PAF18572.1 dihydrodipicolinate synthase family protein [Terribacillus saccharophilus]
MLNEVYHIAVPTAFYSDESLNVEGTINHIKNLYQKGVRSVLVCGSTGEQHSLSLDEKLILVEAIEKEEELINNMEIIFGVASIRQKEAVELAKHISKTNIAAILIGYPPYIKPSQEEAIRYTEKIVSASKKYAILYNNPGRTGFDLEVETINKLLNIENIIGIKEAGEKTKIKNIKLENDKQYYIYAGGEQGLEDKTAHGFNRLSSIAGNLDPVGIRNWFEVLLKGENHREEELEKVKNVLNIVYTGSPLVNLKKELNSQGEDLGVCRSPLGN